ncbi:MAG: cobalamin-binding protein [Pseudomonadales bacterium]|nr:cobalamin-binding protein [Pseudomonadales bacterium]
MMQVLRLFIKTFLLFWAATYAALCFADDNQHPVSINDDLGNQVTLKQPAKRIVSLAPHNTEILFSIGAGHKVVGTVHYSDYPKAALDIPRIGGYDKINIEQIITLQPDLIVAWRTGNDSRANKRLQDLGYPVYYSEPSSFQDIANSMEKLAVLTGTAEQGKKRKQIFLEKYHELKTSSASKQTIKIYYEVWQNPRYTLGGSHFSAELFTVCGGENIFADVKEKAPIVSLEAILTRNPDVILTGDRHGKETLAQLRGNWKKWPQIKAVKNQQIHYVNADIFTRSSPRAIDAAVALCELLDGVREQLKLDKTN